MASALSWTQARCEDEGDEGSQSHQATQNAFSVTHSLPPLPAMADVKSKEQAQRAVAGLAWPMGLGALLGTQGQAGRGGGSICRHSLVLCSP